MYLFQGYEREDWRVGKRNNLKHIPPSRTTNNWLSVWVDQLIDSSAAAAWMFSRHLHLSWKKGLGYFIIRGGYFILAYQPYLNDHQSSGLGECDLSRLTACTTQRWAHMNKNKKRTRYLDPETRERGELTCRCHAEDRSEKRKVERKRKQAGARGRMFIDAGGTETESGVLRYISLFIW